MIECKQCLNEKEGLQRHIDALKTLLAEKGILMNEGEEKELHEINHLIDDEGFWGKPLIKLEGFQDAIEREREVKDEYNYYLDDLNFDAARERRSRT